MKGGDEEKSSNRVPIWDGKPDHFNHYIQEIRWFFAATKKADRPYAAARLIRRMLDSDYSALKVLMYKLDPLDFEDEGGVNRLIAYLENSPMNRQPIPDAGAKLNQYYRRLSRRPGESIPQFLVREDHSYESMWQALQRLLREKALDFSKYDVTGSDLKEFCGMDPNKSIYFDPEDELMADEEDEVRSIKSSATEKRSDGKPFSSERDGDSSSRLDKSGSKKPKKGRDLLQRLMEKGLIPLAAMDIIRGWLILEMTSSSDVDKSLVKASAQNKLGYDAVRAALLSMHEDRDRFPRDRRHVNAAHWTQDEEWPEDDPPYGDHDQYMGESWNHDSTWQEGCYGGGEEWPDAGEEENPNDPGDTDGANPEAEAMFAQLQEEEQGLQALLADAQRNLHQARQAVADAKKDRGWQGSSGHSGKPKPTSTFLKGKGKGKLKGKFNGPNSPNSSAMWTSSKSSFKGGGKSRFSSSYKGPSRNNGWYQETFESGMLSLESPLPDIYEEEVLRAQQGPASRFEDFDLFIIFPFKILFGN